MNKATQHSLGDSPITNKEDDNMSKKVSKKVVSLKKEIKARKGKIAKHESKLKQLKKKLKKAA